MKKALFALVAAVLAGGASATLPGNAGTNPAVQAGAGAVANPATTSPLATYVPESDAWDNAATDTKMIPTIPSSPQCTVRGQTVFEIRKMRADAKQIGMAIMYEIQTMEKRKAYIEQMSTYLNDRIRELNKVKHDLAAEQKWIDVSNQRIAELAQKEKLIKLEDVMGCIKDEQSRLANERGTKQFTVDSLERQALDLRRNIEGIRTHMNQRLAENTNGGAFALHHQEQVGGNGHIKAGQKAGEQVMNEGF